MSTTKDTTVVILTALDLEYEAVRGHLRDLEVHVHRQGTRFEVGTVPDGSCRVVIGDVGKGNHASGVLAERAIEEFAPKALFFVGVAGRLRDHIKLGDLVVATHVYAYHGGTSEDEGFSARPRGWEVSHKLGQLAGDLGRSKSWTTLLGRDRGSTPAVHRAPIAAGEVVLQSHTSAEARRISLHYNDAAAIEMEGAGIAQAGHLNGCDIIVIRGISDGATAEKAATDKEGWQPRAAKHAAAFAIALAESVATGDSFREPARRARPTDDPAKTAAPTFSNLASGHAQVGIQAGQIFGDAYVDQPRATVTQDIGKQLKDLQDALKGAYDAGRLDAETYASAREELATAQEALPAKDEKGRQKAVIALKRLKGLVEDIADFAAKLGSILTGLGGLR